LSTAGLLERLHPHYDRNAAVHAFTGLEKKAVRYALAEELLSSAEAERLLDAVPGILRMARSDQRNRIERVSGELRGQVAWIETLAARAAAGFPPDLFVCSVPYRNYDVAENRVLRAGLSQLVAAARDLALLAASAFSSPRREEAERRGRLARSHATHRSLADVSTAGGPKALAVARRSKKRSLYEPAIAFAEASTKLLEPTIASLCDRRTRYQHDVLLTVVEAIETHGFPVTFCPENGELIATSLRYRHPGARGSDGAHGIRVGRMLIDVPDIPGMDNALAQRQLSRRAGPLETLLVTRPGDLPMVAERVAQTLDGESTISASG
jgi:hypothetical protein